jgi:hypothetical protein
MTLYEQLNAFNKSNHQPLIIDRTVRQRLSVYSSLNNVDDSNIELKTLSIDVYTTKHLVAAAGKSVLSYSERTRLDELLLPSINKDIDRDENHRRRKRKRPSHRRSLLNSYSLNSTEFDLAQLTTHAMKSESQTTIPIITDDDTDVSFPHHHAPPPSPSDEEIKRLLYVTDDNKPSRPPARQSPIEKEGYIPYRLPVLNQSARFHRTSTSSPLKDIRSTLSNYLRKYY